MASTTSSSALEDEILQSRLERSNRRSRLLERGVKGINPRASPDADSANFDPLQSVDINNDSDGQRQDSFSPTMSSTSSNNHANNSANVLSRYGGQAGPTGATFAPAAGASPVSLANFIGGRAAGPRLGKLQGDGRSAPPEAETFFRDYPTSPNDISGTSPARRGIALPGLASPPPPGEAATNNKPLAAFLAARANALGGSSSSTTGTAPSASPSIAQAAPAIGSSANRFAQTDSASADKFPTASLTRLSAKGMVGQRIREAQERHQSSPLSPSSPDVSVSAGGSNNGPGLAALRERWAHAGSSAPAGLSIAAPARTSPTKERSPTGPFGGGVGASSSSAQTPSSATTNAPWQPGRFANALPGMANTRSAAEAKSPTPVASSAGLPSRDESSDASGRRSPVRLPGVGGAAIPTRLQTAAADPTLLTNNSAGAGAAAANGSSETVQPLKSLTASRPRGPTSAKKSRAAATPASRAAAPTTATATSQPEAVERDEEVVIPSFRAPTPSQPVADPIAAAAASPLAHNPLPRPPSPQKEAYGSGAGSGVASLESKAGAVAQVQPQQPAVKRPDPAKGRRSTVGKRILVLISGSGSNFQALIDSTIPSLRTSGQPQIPYAQIVGVISNRKAAFGLERARVADPPIPTEVFSLKTFRDTHPGQGRDEYDEALAKLVLGFTPDVVVLAGFMHIVSPRFLAVLGHGAVAGSASSSAPAPPIINLHPALPGQFDGAGAIERAFEAYRAGSITQTGVMVHEVIAEVDRGAPVLVETVDMTGLDSLEELEEKIHSIEHRLIVDGTRKVLDRPPAPSPALGGASSPLVDSLSGSASPRAAANSRQASQANVNNKRQSVLFTSPGIGGSGAGFSPSAGASTPPFWSQAQAQQQQPAAASSAGPLKIEIPAVLQSVADFRAKQVDASLSDGSSDTSAVEVLVVNPDGSTRTLSSSLEARTLYDSELHVVVHRRTSRSAGRSGANAGTRTRVFVCVGADLVSGRSGGGAAPTSWRQGPPGETVAELATKYRVVGAEEVVEVVQGEETPELALVLGAVGSTGGGADAGASASAAAAAELIFREGSRSRDGSAGGGDASVMFAVRRLGPAVVIDQVAVATSCLCSSQSAVASLLNDVFVWHGRGSSTQQRQSAERFATTLTGGDPSRLRCSEEGREDDHFAMFFDVREGYASAWHHRHASLLSPYLAIPILLELTSASQNGAAPAQVASAPALEGALDRNAISVIELGLEVYVVIPAASRGRKADIAQALDLAERLGQSLTKSIANDVVVVGAAHTSSRTSPVHVVVLPGKLPRDLRAGLRGHFSAGSPLASLGAGGAGRDQLNVVELAQARIQLGKSVADFDGADLVDSSCLPVGVAPEDL
ncbi:hypothetical protein V8E36_005434 [Tilletia maclaganii]